MKKDFDKLSFVLKNIFKNIDHNTIVSKTDFFNLWGDIVGPKFEKTSHPVKLEDGVLTIATLNSCVTSELTMFKGQLLKKIQKRADEFSIKIEEVRFSHKIFQKEKEEKTEEKDNNIRIYEKDYIDIELDEEELLSVKKSVDAINFLEKEKRESLTKSISKDLKRDKYYKINSIKVCPNCFAPYKGALDNCETCSYRLKDQ